MRRHIHFLCMQILLVGRHLKKDRKSILHNIITMTCKSEQSCSDKLKQEDVL